MDKMSSTIKDKANLVGWSPYVKVYDPLKAGSIDGTDLIPHDNAVIRALSAEYIPPDKQSFLSNPSNTLFVARLNLRTSEKQLREEFSKYGSVKSCRVVEDIVTGISRGYGFIEFKREADAQKAWRLAHGSTFHERQILVEWEFSRTMPGWIPRRLGGGLGGRKESGQLRFGGRDRPFKRPFILPPEQDIAHSESSHKSIDSLERLKTFDELGKFSSSRNDYGKTIQHRNNFEEDKNKHKRNTKDYLPREGNKNWQSKPSEVRDRDQYAHTVNKTIDEQVKFSSSWNDFGKTGQHRNNFDEDKVKHKRNAEDYSPSEGNKNWQSKPSEVRDRDQYAHTESRRTYRKETYEEHSRHSHSNVEERKYRAHTSNNHSKYDNSRKSFTGEKKYHPYVDKRKYEEYDDENYESWCDKNSAGMSENMSKEQFSGRKGGVGSSHYKHSHGYETSYYNLNKEKYRPNKEKEDKFIFSKSDFNLEKSEFKDVHQKQQETSETDKRSHKRKPQKRDSTDSSEPDEPRIKKKQKKSKHKRKRDRSASATSDSSIKNKHARSHKKKKKKKKRTHLSSGSNSD